MKRIEFETAQHLCSLVARFFDNIAESSPEYGEDFVVSRGAFVKMCKDFTFDQGELEGAEEVAERVSNLAKAILKMAE